MATKAPTPRTTAAKPKPKPYAPVGAATGGSDAEPEAQSAPTEFIRRKEFVARIVASSGLKPNAVKTVLDAVLNELGDALSKGEALHLPPLGKLSVNRQKDLKRGEVLICKLRRVPPAPKAEAPLADDQD